MRGLVLLLSILAMGGCSRNDNNLVTLYAAQDQEYVQPILKKFTFESGLRVQVVYDSEAVKTVGLANRLLAERTHPHCAPGSWPLKVCFVRRMAGLPSARAAGGWSSTKNSYLLIKRRRD